MEYLFNEYEVERDDYRCSRCEVCAKQCANGVHKLNELTKSMEADNFKCVNCHRCVSLCPSNALKIIKNRHTFKDNANWSRDNITEIFKQAATGGVLLSSMGNPKDYPGYFDRMLINASQVTNPSIDPLREPMETKTFLGKKITDIVRDSQGNTVYKNKPVLELSVPIMFSAPRELSP